MSREETLSKARPQDPSECRCLCGSLIARRVSHGVELKCRRCKRRIVVPLEGDDGAAEAAVRP